MTAKRPTAYYLNNEVVVWDEKDIQKIHRDKYFGKILKNHEGKEYLKLLFVEAAYLLEKGMINIKDYKTEDVFSFDTFYSLCCSLDKEFPQKYVVFRDLRDRGYVVKSGFKFGTHFRVYEKGVNPYKKGEKTKREHTRFNVHAYLENKVFTFQELSRYVRLSHNIRAQALIAIVDEENEVTYYLISRIKP